MICKYAGPDLFSMLNCISGKTRDIEIMIQLWNESEFNSSFYFTHSISTMIWQKISTIISFCGIVSLALSSCHFQDSCSGQNNVGLG